MHIAEVVMILFLPFFFFSQRKAIGHTLRGNKQLSSIIRLSSKLHFFSRVCLHIPLPSEVAFKVTAQPGWCGDSLSALGVRESEVRSDPARAGEDLGGSEKRH